jgi:quercetin dioxygenase-like cupin family protein
MAPQVEKTMRPYALAAEQGKVLGWFDSTVIQKASSRDLGVTELRLKPGEEPPLHIHEVTDEWFYVLEGELTCHVGEENLNGKAGAFISMPHGIPHTFSVESAEAHFLVLNTPGGFERMFEMAPKTPEEAERAMKAHGMEVIGPHPRHG